MDANDHTSVANDRDVLVGGDDEITYRSVSVLSIVALVVGMLAPLCLLAPLLWAVPLLGVVLSLAAILRVKASEGLLVGRGAALVGLALCVTCLFAVTSRAVAARQLVSWQARRVALEWVALLQAGDSHQAFGWILADAQPREGDVGTGPLQRFREDSLVRYLETDAADLHASFYQDLDTAFGPAGVVSIRQLIGLSSVADGTARRVGMLEIVLQRTRGRWLVVGYERVEPTASTIAK